MTPTERHELINFIEAQAQSTHPDQSPDPIVSNYCIAWAIIDMTTRLGTRLTDLDSRLENLETALINLGAK